MPYLLYRSLGDDQVPDYSFRKVFGQTFPHPHVQFSIQSKMTHLSFRVYNGYHPGNA